MWARAGQWLSGPLCVVVLARGSEASVVVRLERGSGCCGGLVVSGLVSGQKCVKVFVVDWVFWKV